MKKSFTRSGLKLTCSILLLFICQSVYGTYTPVTLLTSGTGALNADVIADTTGYSSVGMPPAYGPTTTAAFDASSYVLIAQNYKPTATSLAPPNSLPMSGQVVNNIPGGPTYQLAPYTGNNSLRLTGTLSGTLTLPGNLIGDVYLLGAAADVGTTGSATFTATITFVGGTTQVYTGQTMGDWYNTTAANAAAYGVGRALRASPGTVDVSNLGSTPRLFQVKLALPITQYNKQIQSITIAKTSSTGELNILAVVIDHQSCLPPQTPTATGITLTTANLAWVAPLGGATGYQYAITNSATPPASGTNIATNTYNAVGLTSATTYYLHVRTDCGGGSYSLWNTISFTTSTCPAVTVTIPAATITMTQAVVNWTTASTSQPSAGYEYVIDQTATAPTVPGTFTTATTVTATNLNAATTYYAHVRNVCISGASWSTWTNVAFTTKPCPTTAPVTVGAGSITTVSATLNWTTPAASSNPSTGYEYALTTSATPPASGTFTTALSYSAFNLTPGTTYYMHVRNVCSGGFNSVWTTISFTTLGCPSAGTPSIITNVPGQIIFSWPGTSTPGVTTYQYAVTTTSAAPTASSYIPPTNTSASPDTINVIAGATYWIWVRSYCNPTTSAWLSVNSTGVLNPFPNCLPPAGNISHTNVNMHGASISWLKGPTAVDYQYQVTQNSNPPVNGTVTPDTFYNATGLASNTLYYVHVRSRCGSTAPLTPLLQNYSVWLKDSFMTPATCIAPLPGNVSITNITPYSAYGTWTFYPGIYGYEYFLNTNPASPTFAGIPITYNAIAPLNLSSGTTYYLHVRTRCDVDSFSQWVNVSFNTENVCTPTSTPAVNNVTSHTASFSWSSVTGASAYEYAITSSPTPPTSGVYTSLSSYTALNLTSSTTYYFHVRAFCSNSDLSIWKTVDFTTLPDLGVPSVVGGGTFNVEVYPNPADDIMHVAISGRNGATGRIQIVDISGKVVQTVTTTTDKVDLDLTKLASGVYMLKYVDSENSGVIRIKKQ
jgi:hypothetical protein